MLLHQSNVPRKDWLARIQQEELEQSNANLVPTNATRRNWLNALKEVANRTNSDELTEQDIENNIRTRMFLQNEYDDPYFNYNSLDDGNWVKTVSRAFIDNDANTKQMLKNRNINSYKELEDRLSIIREKALTDDVPPEQMETYINQAMLLPQDEFDKRIVAPLGEWKVKKKLDPFLNLTKLAWDAMQAWDKQNELKKIYSQDRLVDSLKKFESNLAGSYKRFRARTIPMDLMDEYRQKNNKNFTSEEDFINYDPKVHEADARRNHFWNTVHNVFVSEGFGDDNENEEMLADKEIRAALTSDIKVEDKNGWRYLGLNEARAHEDPNSVFKYKDNLVRLQKAIRHYWQMKGKSPRYRYYNGHAFNADELDSSIRSDAERERDFIDDYITRKFTDSDNPLVRRYRDEQKAAVIQGYKQFGEAFTDVLDGMPNLDNIRPERLHTIADNLNDFKEISNRHLNSQVGRRQYGQEIYTDENAALEKARKNYDELYYHNDASKKEYRTHMVAYTPILLNHVKNPKTGALDIDAFNDQTDDYFNKSAEPFDPKNANHLETVQKIRIADFSKEPGKAVPSAAIPGAVLITRRGANGKTRLMVKHPNEEYFMDWPVNDPEIFNIQQPVDYAKRTLRQKPVEVSRDEYKAALVLSRANNEEKINEVSKEPGKLQYYSMSGKKRRAYERQQQAKPVIQQASQNLRAGKDDYTKGLEGERAAKEIQIRKIANIDPIRYEDFMPWEQRDPHLIRTIKRFIGVGDEDASLSDKLIRAALAGAALFSTKKAWDSRQPRPPKPLPPPTLNNEALQARTQIIVKKASEPVIKSEIPSDLVLYKTQPPDTRKSFTGSTTSSVVEYAPYNPPKNEYNVDD